mmetsp:Transcript_11168/g.25002  ORF Transcript_11168/g.25002 Transcript_11168/m.25002 type:complete len:221 (-) Transcript_11168:18-680(-)
MAVQGVRKVSLCAEDSLSTSALIHCRRQARHRTTASRALVLRAAGLVALVLAAAKAYEATRAWTLLRASSGSAVIGRTRSQPVLLPQSREDTLALVTRGAAEREAAPLVKLQAGDRLIGWMKHPVATKAEKMKLTIEVGPGDDEGTWRIERPNADPGALPIFEGSCAVRPGDGPDIVILRDDETVLNGTLNGAGPGTLKGRVAQNGLMWGGYFEACLEEL